MNRVVHFEIHATDPERAAAFYRAAVDWDVKEWVIPGVQIPNENRYWLATTGPDTARGINGGVMFRRGAPPAEGQPVNAYVCTIGVASLDESLQRVITAGGTMAVPKMPIKSVGWLAYCTDTEGNIFGMIQSDPSVG